MTKADIIEIGKRIYEKNYTAAHDGNISFYDGKTVFITPSGVSKGFMSEDGISELTIDGRVLNGAVPSSEYKMHLAVYKNNPSVHAVVHTHPVYATTFACMGKPLKSEVLAEAVFQLGDIPLAEYGEPGTEKAAQSIVPYCVDYNGVLLEKHGLVTWGNTLNEAWFRTEIAEFLAKITFNINVGRSLSE